MLKVKTRIGPSGVHGTGLFADQFIPKGTVTWQYDPEFDLGITEEKLQSLSPLAAEYLRYYCYFDKNLQKYILCSDSQRFINHTANRALENILSTPTQDTAARDIQPGEEFLCDYNKFDDQYFERMNLSADKLK